MSEIINSKEKLGLQGIDKSWAIALVLLFLFIFCRNGYFIVYPDSADYLYLRSHLSEGWPAWKEAFFRRPIAVGVFYAVFKENRTASYMLSVISFASWWYLAQAVSKGIKEEKLRLVIFALFLSGIFAKNIMMWNSAILSESLSMSLLCWHIGATTFYLLHKGRISPVLISALLLAFTRDTTSYLLLTTAWMFIFISRHGLNTSYVTRIVVCGAILAIAVISILSAGDTDRHVIPLKNNILMRVLSDKSASKFIENSGLNLTQDQKITCVNKWAYACQFDETQEQWFLKEGGNKYQRWILASLSDRFDQFLKALPASLPEDITQYLYNRSTGIGKLLGDITIVGKTDYVSLCSTFKLILIFLSFIYILNIFHMISINTLLGIGVFFFWGGLLNAFIAYWGDTTEIPRHLLQPALCMNLGLWLILTSFVEIIFHRVCTDSNNQSRLAYYG